MFPTPPSLEQHPAFSPIMTYRDTPSQEPPVPSGPADRLPSIASTQLTEHRMEVEDDIASPRQEDMKVRKLHQATRVTRDDSSYIILHFLTCSW